MIFLSAYSDSFYCWQPQTILDGSQLHVPLLSGGLGTIMRP